MIGIDCSLFFLRSLCGSIATAYNDYELAFFWQKIKCNKKRLPLNNTFHQSFNFQKNWESKGKSDAAIVRERSSGIKTKNSNTICFYGRN